MKRILIIFTVAFCFLKTNAQNVTYCPLDMNNINGFPAFFCTPSHDVMWVGVFNGDNTTIYARTTDAGSSFFIDSLPDPNRAITSIFALNKDTAWAGATDLVGSNGGAVYKTLNGGIDWTKQTTTEYTASGAYFDWICFFSADSGVILGDPVGGVYEIYTTTDGGNTWNAVPSVNIPAPLSGEWGLTNDYSTFGNKIWSATNKGRIFYSNDKGYHWSVSSINPALGMMGISMADELNGVAYKIESNTAFLTSDGGVTWTPKILSPSITFCYLSASKGVQGAYVFKSATGSIYATSDNFNSYVLLDNTHLTSHNELVMYDASIGWTQSAYMNYNNAIIKISNVPYGIFSPQANSNQLGIFPNPVTKNVALVSFNHEKNTDILLSLYDITGKCLKNQIYNGNIGKNAVIFDFFSIAKGLYLLTLDDGLRKSSIKVVVE